MTNGSLSRFVGFHSTRELHRMFPGMRWSFERGLDPVFYIRVITIRRGALLPSASQPTDWAARGGPRAGVPSRINLWIKIPELNVALSQRE